MVRAVLGGTVTTTGGRGDVHLDAPVIDSADGDDIVVMAPVPHSRPRGRMRAFLVAAIVLVLAAAGITVALVSRHDTGATKLRSVSARQPSPKIKTPPSRRARVATTAPKKPRIVVTTSVAPTVPSTGVVAVAPPPVTPTAPPAT